MAVAGLTDSGWARIQQFDSTCLQNEKPAGALKHAESAPSPGNSKHLQTMAQRQGTSFLCAKRSAARIKAARLEPKQCRRVEEGGGGLKAPLKPRGFSWHTLTYIIMTILLPKSCITAKSCSQIQQLSEVLHAAPVHGPCSQATAAFALPWSTRQPCGRTSLNFPWSVVLPYCS